VAAAADRAAARLELAGARLAAAETERAAAIAAVQKAVRAAHGKLPVTEIARLAGISRPTVYTMLKND